MKISPHTPFRQPLSEKAWGAIFGALVVGWAAVFAYGAVITRIA
jgi:hypothetical protein